MDRHRHTTSLVPAANPLFPKRARRWQPPSPPVDLAIIGSVAVVFFLASLLPPFRVTRIEVTGQERLNPAFVVDQTQGLLAGRRWGILPQSAFLYLPASEFAGNLKARLSAVVPMQEVRVVKRFPRTLQLVVHETEPSAILKTATGEHALDERGTLSGIFPATQGIPILEERNGLSFQPGESVVSPSVIASLATIRDELERRALGPIEFRTAEVRCPFDLRRPGREPIEVERQPTVGEGGANTNQPANRNLAVVIPRPLPQPACDRKRELRVSPELSLVTSEGWELWLTTSRSVEESLLKLFLALDTKLTNRQGLKRIDLRFLPRIFYE